MLLSMQLIAVREPAGVADAIDSQTRICIRTFEVTPYLSVGIFQELQDQQAFNSVRPFLGSIRWENGQNLCPDTLYLDSVPVYALQQVAA